MSEVGFPLDDSVVYITATQKELETETSATNPGAAGGGLLGVLIASSVDSTRNRRAEEAVVELRDAMIDFEISGEFVRKIKASEVTEQLSLLTPQVIAEEPGADATHGQDFVELHPFVRLSNELRALHVGLWIREYELNDNMEPRFAGFAHGYTYVYSIPEPDSGRSREDYAEAWLELGVETIQEQILFGMNQTILAAQSHIQEGDLELEDSARYRIPEYSSRVNYDFWHENDEATWLQGPANNEITIATTDAVVKLD